MQQCVIRVILYFILAVPLRAQTGSSISGRVTASGKPVEYAVVFIRNTTFATTADSVGRFTFIHIEAGSYTVEASAIGFKPTEIQCRVFEGETTNIELKLESDQRLLDEVVITGVAKATRLREDPVAITSIQAKTIRQTTESNIIDALVKAAPGLNAVKTGPNISKPFIRGLGYNRVLTLYDGVRQEGQQWGDEHGIEVDAYAIEKAELVKGPASLMYGSDALAGVLSLMPSEPAPGDSMLHGKFTTEYQSNNGLAGAGLGLFSNKKHWSMSWNGSYRRAGNYQNSVDGRVYNTGFDEKNLTATLGYQSRSGVSWLKASLYDNQQGIPDGSRDSVSRRFTKQVFEGEADTLTRRPLVSQQELDAYGLSPLHQRIQHYRLYSKHRYRLAFGGMEALLAFQHNRRREYTHPSMPEKAGLYVKLNTVNYGLTYHFPELRRIEASAGINGMWQHNKNGDATDFPIPDYKLFDAGLFVHLKWKHNRWTLGGGLRYDVRYIGWHHFYVATDASSGFQQQVTGIDTVGTYLQYPSFSKSFGGLSASLGTTCRLSRQISLKVNIARGYRAPGITELASNGLDPGAHIIYYGNRSFQPEFSLQEDVGFIGDFNSLNASLSFFNNHIQDYIYLSQLTDAGGMPLMDAQGNRTFQYQQASAQLYGFEAFCSLHPPVARGLLFDNSFTCVYGYNRSPLYKGVGTQGEYLPFIPPARWLSKLSMNVVRNHRWIRGLSPRIELEYNAAQNRFLALYQTETYTRSYAIINIGAVVELSYRKSGTLELQVQVNNLSNVAYQSNLSRLKYFEYYTGSPNGHLGIYGMGRNVCLKLTGRF